MAITYGDYLIDSGYYDITPEQEREMEHDERASDHAAEIAAKDARIKELDGALCAQDALLDAWKTRLEAAERSLAEADTRIGILETALEPFKDCGEYLALETEGFADTDEVNLYVADGEPIYRLRFIDFRRAALAGTDTPEKAGA